MLVKKKGICGMCPDACDIIATIEDGRLTTVEPDPDSPRGRVCPRGTNAPKMIYAEDRILTPLLRDGERGSGSFRRASWDEALDYIADKLRSVIAEYGPDAAAGYFGGSAREESTWRSRDFFKVIGSSCGFSACSICNVSSNVITPVTTMGVPTRRLKHDSANSEVIFVWGKNPATDSGPLPFLRPILRGKQKGAKIVVIDPRGEVLKDLRDLWIPIIPGSDGALALAMLKLIIESGRYDHDFVSRFTRGFDEFKAYLEGQELDVLSAYCGIPLADIRELTELFLSTEKISLVSYTGLEYQLSGIQNNRAIQVLWAITGKLDVPGGMCFNGEHFPTLPLQPANPKHRMEGHTGYPIFSGLVGEEQFAIFPSAVLKGKPFPIRAFFICAGSPAVSRPNQPMWHEIYRSLDLLVVLDRFMTEDARFADVVLPASIPFENFSVRLYKDGGMRLRERLIEPRGEAKSDMFIFQAIAERVGFGDKLPKTDDELALYLLNGDSALYDELKTKPEGIPGKPLVHYRKYESGLLREDGQPGFPTPSGKFEISSVYLEQCGYTGYPEYHDVRTLKGLDGEPGEYPFMLTTAARDSHRFSSFGANIPCLAAAKPVPKVDISPEDAAELGVSENDPVTIETPFGKKTYPARLCPMARGSVHVPYGGGSAYMPKAWHEGNINDLLSWDYRDPISGFIILRSQPCKVYKGSFESES